MGLGSVPLPPPGDTSPVASQTENPGQSPRLQEAGIQGPVRGQESHSSSWLGGGDGGYLWFAGTQGGGEGSFLGPLNTIPHGQGPHVSPGHHNT